MAISGRRRAGEKVRVAFLVLPFSQTPTSQKPSSMPRCLYWPGPVPNPSKHSSDFFKYEFLTWHVAQKLFKVTFLQEQQHLQLELACWVDLGGCKSTDLKRKGFIEVCQKDMHIKYILQTEHCCHTGRTQIKNLYPLQPPNLTVQPGGSHTLTSNSIGEFFYFYVP